MYSKLSINGRLIGDAEIASLLSMSRSWVRKERFNRRHGVPHFFDIDPVYIGSSPRYRTNDVVKWMERKVHNANSFDHRSNGRAGQ